MQFNIIFKTIFEYIHKSFRFMHTNTFCKYRKKLLASPRVHLVTQRHGHNGTEQTSKCSQLLSVATNYELSYTTLATATYIPRPPSITSFTIYWKRLNKRPGISVAVSMFVVRLRLISQIIVSGNPRWQIAYTSLRLTSSILIILTS